MSVHPYDPYSDPEIDGWQDDVPPHTEPPKPARPRPDEDPPW